MEHRPEPIRTLADALERLETLLPEYDPDLYESLNPPVVASDLQALQNVIKPHELHPDIEALLRWHDGQIHGRWWPLIESGNLLTAENAREHYLQMDEHCEPFQWSSSWMPIAHEGWYTIVVECALPLAGMVVDAGFPDPPQPKAFSLMHVMRCVCNLIEANIPLKAPARGPATDSWMDDRNAALRRAWPHFLE